MVSVEGLTMAFGDKAVLSDISIAAGEGETIAIMGSSGGGKTTLLKCIAGLLRPQKGQIRVAGIDVQAMPDAARQKMGMVFQSSALFDFLDVETNVLFGVRRRQRLSGDEESKLVKEMLDAVELGDIGGQFPSELSGGMKKRVGIARALALKPQVMLYDEPTTGLDPVTAYTIDALIAHLAKQFEMTSLVVTHDVTSVSRVANRVAFLDQGRLVFDGPVAEFKQSKHPGIAELVAKAGAEELSVQA
jgi:phospholipid/cholesterol/gamma-HCH transport system ATP-binding protein